MANKDAPFGLTPIKHRNGAPYNGATRQYFVNSSYAVALFVGDPVIKTGTSNTTVVEGANIATLPEINKATAGDGNAITGVIVSFGANGGDNQTRTHNPASTERIVNVADDPDLLFLVQDDGGGALDATTVGLNAVLIFTESGSTSTGQSGVEMDGGTSDAPAADLSNQLTIQRLHDVEGNTVDDFALWEVKINNHTEAHGVIGI